MIHFLTLHISIPTKVFPMVDYTKVLNFLSYSCLLVLFKRVDFSLLRVNVFLTVRLIKSLLSLPMKKEIASHQFSILFCSVPLSSINIRVGHPLYENIENVPYYTTSKFFFTPFEVPINWNPCSKEKVPRNLNTLTMNPI